MTVRESVAIRPARLDDLPGLTEVYNHYVETSAATFDLEPFGVEERRSWFDRFSTDGPHRLLVAADASRVCGFAYSGAFRDRGAYATSVETTVYCAPDTVGTGVGSELYAALFDAIAGEGLHRAYAGVSQPNDASMALHRKFGFEVVGTYHEVGRKFGRWWDVTWLEKPL